MPYAYQPLDDARKEFRLLRATVRCRSGEKLSFDTIIASLDGKQTPSYSAISYVWGANPALTSIQIDGKQVDVPDSSEEALAAVIVTLQNHGRPFEYFWIDAICINQDDLVEKSTQVAMMADIYASAESVYAWLGHGEPSRIDEEVKMLEQLREECYLHTKGVKGFELDRYNEDRIALHRELPVPPGFDISALLPLLASKWFTRLWILQEASLAKQLTVVRGLSLISWTLISTAIRWLDHRDLGSRFGPTLNATLGPAFNFTLIVVDGADFPMGLHGMLIASDMLDTSNPWDRLYALLGLVNRGEASSAPQLIVPDYNKPLKDVYADATRLAIRQSGELYLLGYKAPDLPGGDDTVPNDGSWPSWVPRYYLPLEQDVWVTQDSGNACSLERIVPDLLGDTGQSSDVLTLRGVLFDTIESIAFPLGPMVPDQEGQPRPPWSLLLWDLATSANEQNIWSIAEALVGGYHGFTGATVDQDDLKSDFAAFMLRLKDEQGLRFSPRSVLEEVLNAASSTTGDADRYRGETIQIAKNSLVRLRSGKYCIVQKAVKAGDAVCVLFGSQLPLVLRADSGANWTLRGVAYVPGIMQGEYIDELEEQGRLEAETATFNVV